MSISKITICNEELNIGLDASEQDHSEWYAAATAALRAAFPGADVSTGRTDGMRSLLLLESDTPDYDVVHDHHHAIQVLERMW